VFTDYDRKIIIPELKRIADEACLIDFIRTYFYRDYADVLNKECANKGYRAHLLKMEILKRFNVNYYFDALKYIKVIIFYEYLIAYIDNGTVENERRNIKIKEYKEKYSLYKAIISNGNYNMNRFPKVAELFYLNKITKQEFEDDIVNGKHFYAEYILDNFIEKYIDEYNSYL